MDKISPYQKRSLEFYLYYKEKKLTLAGIWLFNLRLYVSIFLIFVIFISGYYFLAGSSAAIIVGALFVGALARDIGTLWKSVRNWPLLQQIIDWDKAASMLDQAKKQPSEGTKTTS